MSFGAAARVLSGHAAQLLGWPPDAFWAATPAELEAALGGSGEGAAGPSRDEVDALMALHPDEERHDGR